ncbi:hypothetical protein [Flammeovirga sp. SJP92]|uniref:hypothetical protein n=1 Tax=Flammeovirga sp. SJP92 TaxID=1775430 RepID=UPI0007888BFD|nr:hypothetical protein [Flammeovirga sp. SJP92]KXX70443.1 hypothetical protein AVL50_08780 [Flammeovirga sp. SJP92]
MSYLRNKYILIFSILFLVGIVNIEMNQKNEEQRTECSLEEIESTNNDNWSTIKKTSKSYKKQKFGLMAMK